MEKPSFNNLPKNELDEKSQQTEKFLDVPEKESGKRKNITLEIMGRKIEAEKYYFEYPEQVQKETGILGYERIKMPKESITMGANGLFLSLSNGEYPTKCFNHAFSGYVNGEQKNAYYDEFKKSKFFLQKIYSIDSRKRLSKDSFDHKGISGQRSFVELINKDTSVSTYDNDRERSEYLTGMKNLEEDNKSIFAELNFEISKFWGEAYHGNNSSTIGNSSEDFEKKYGLLGFGFSMNDKFLEKYLEESLHYLGSIKGKSSNLVHMHHDHFERLNGAAAVIWNLVFFDNKIQEILFNTDKKEKQHTDVNDIRDIVDVVFSEIEQKTSFPVTEFLSKNSNYYKEPMRRLNEHLNINYDEDSGFDYFKACFISKTIAFQKGERMNDASIYDETHIPVFINNDKLPQLSWGHAKYAHALDEDGFNFFTFKHADHLPVKEKEVIGSPEY